jgi:excisionase family DNA binding protein
MPPSVELQIRLTVAEAAKRLRVDSDKIRLWIRRGEFPGSYNAAARTGPGTKPRWRIPLAAIEAFETRRAAVPTTPAPRHGRWAEPASGIIEPFQ